MNGFPTFESQQWLEFCILALSEFLFLVDIVINFILQELDEEGNSKLDTLEDVALKNFNST
jgi:hypothetical protein